MDTIKSKNARQLLVMENIQFYLFIAPWLIGFVFLTLGPMIASLYFSFTDWTMFTQPEFNGFDNYINAFKNEVFLLSLSNTFKYTFLSIFISIIISLMMAYTLTLPLKGAKIFKTIFYMPTLVPIVATSMIFILLLAPNGYINLFLGLFGIKGPEWLLDTKYVINAFVFLSVWGVGSTIVLTMAAIQGISESLFDAAYIDGAGRIICFLKITIPMISPVLFFNLVMGIIGSLQTFAQVHIMTGGGPNNSSMMIVPYLYNEAFKYNHMGYASAIAWILFIIIIAFTGLVFKGSSFWVFYQSEVNQNDKKA